MAQLAEVFLRFAEWRNQFEPAPKGADGLDRSYLDEWEFAFNPANERREMVPGLSTAVYRHGMPVGVIDPTGGVLVPGIEDELIDALESAKAKMDAYRQHEGVRDGYRHS